MFCARSGSAPTRPTSHERVAAASQSLSGCANGKSCARFNSKVATCSLPSKYQPCQPITVKPASSTELPSNTRLACAAFTRQRKAVQMVHHAHLRMVPKSFGLLLWPKMLPATVPVMTRQVSARRRCRQRVFAQVFSRQARLPRVGLYLQGNAGQMLMTTMMMSGGPFGLLLSQRCTNA